MPGTCQSLFPSLPDGGPISDIGTIGSRHHRHSEHDNPTNRLAAALNPSLADINMLFHFKISHIRLHVLAIPLQDRCWASFLIECQICFENSSISCRKPPGSRAHTSKARFSPPISRKSCKKSTVGIISSVLYRGQSFFADIQILSGTPILTMTAPNAVLQKPYFLVH